MTTRARLFPLTALVGTLAVFATADTTQAQIPVVRSPFVALRVSPYLPPVPVRIRYYGVSARTASAALTYQYTRFYRPVAVLPPYREPTTSVGYGSGGNPRVAGIQRAAIAEAQQIANVQPKAGNASPDFDRWLKEAAKWRETPTGDERPDALPIDAELIDPPDEAILNGDALNRLAARIRELERTGKKATTGLFSPELTTRIVFVGGPAADAANLFRATKLDTPAVLLDDSFLLVRTDLERAFAAVAKDVSAGKKPKPADVERLQIAVQNAKDATRQVVADAPFDDARDLCEFFATLTNATKYLKDENAMGVAGIEWSVVGATVAELANHLDQFDLKIGPARTGGEESYYTLHRGMVTYCIALAEAK